jgi:hypothetical protein
MTTYLFYQGLANMGDAAGSIAARVEMGDKEMQDKVDRIWNLSGPIEVYTQNKQGRWVKINELNEMGPIAEDVHLVPIPETGNGKLRVRLRLTRGLWRIDYLALGQLTQDVHPIRVRPSSVIKRAGDLINAQITQTDSMMPLITMPGDQYELNYDIPDLRNTCDVFLSTKGYYLEWMRETWLAEKNMKNVALMFGFPKIYMRRIAPAYKALEPSMEEAFWNSRYVKKN